MQSHEIRPAAGNLRFQLFARALHPELFDIAATRMIERPDYQLVLRICEAGHVIELRRHGEVITETNLVAGRLIPQRGLCLTSPIGAGRDLQAQPLPDVSFQAAVQMETLEREVFERITSEFQCDSSRASVSRVFGSRNRLRPEAVSLLFANCGPRSVGIHAYHSFPEDLAIVRTQSLYEFGAPNG
jgi:hypothetical protein